MASLRQDGALNNNSLREVILKLQFAILHNLLTTGTLAIKAGASAIAKTTTTLTYQIKGVYYSKVASDMAALVGTVLNGTYNVFCFYVDASGTVTTRMGVASPTFAGVTFPTNIDGQVMIGYVSIHPTGTGSFVGGTTALDDAAVVPNASYVNTIGVFSGGAVDL